MKNKMKKVLSMLIVMAMLFSVGMTAFAVEDAGTATYDITIADANAGHTYGAYQLFSGDISGTAEDSTTYLLVNIEWGASVVSEDSYNYSTELLKVLVADSLIGTYFSTSMTAEDVAKALRDDNFSSYSTAMNQFAKVVGQFLLDKNVTTYKETNTYNTVDGTYTIEDVEAGYYLIMDMEEVETDASTLYILDVAKDIEVTPKTGVPTVEKKVMEDTTLGQGNTLSYDGSNYNDAADWDLGQTESFTLYASLPTEMWGYDTYSIAFNDSYDAGFTITDASGTALTTGTINPDNYNVYYFYNNVRYNLDSDTFTATLTTPPTEAAEDTDGKIVFSCTDIKSVLMTGGTATSSETAVPVTSGEVVVVIEYYAELNEDAVLGLGGNLNEVYLEYTNDPYNLESIGKTEEDVVVVFAFELEGIKYDADNKNTKLDGAEFILGISTSSETGVNVPDEWAVLDENGYFLNWTANESEATTLTTDEDGLFQINGLDSGVYFLRETVAPVGYNKIDYDVKIEVVSVAIKDEKTENIYTQSWNSKDVTDVITGYNIYIDSSTDPDYQNITPITIEVANESGSKLPETGDTGRAIFYALGAMGFSAAAIVLITRKRMSKYDK